MNEVWIVGRTKSGQGLDVCWDLQGVFTEEASAVAACRDETYWTARVPFNTAFPHETIVFPESRFPLAG